MGTMSVGRGRIIAAALVICAIVTGVAVLSMRSAAVQAQEPLASAEAAPVAVLDFVNRSSYGGDALGRSAADALVLAMSESDEFEPLQRAEVDEALARLGFSVPMGKTAQARLGEELEVPYVASGTINDVHFEQVNQGRVAVVDVTVGLLGVASGEYVNGARVTERSSPKPGYAAADDALVDEALTVATYDAVRTMISYEMPHATILSATPSDAYLNAGSRSGLVEGMELVVMRFGEKVGRLRIVDVEPTYATASITANYRGVTVGDTAIPVFAPPSAAARPAAVRRPKARTKLNNTLLGLLAAGGIFFTLSKNSPGDEPVPGVQASALTDPTGAREGVLVTWSPAGHQWRNVRAYEIWRNDMIRWVKPATGAEPTGGGLFFIDEENLEYDGLDQVADMTIDSTTGALTLYQFRAVESGDPDYVGGGGATGTSYVRRLVSIPPTAGQQYIYRVVAVVADVTFTPGGEEEEEEEEEEGEEEEGEEEEGGTIILGGETGQPAPSKLDVFRQVAAARQEAPERSWILKESPYVGRSGVATYVAPPPIVSPTAGGAVEDLTEVLFSWTAVAGADEYILQISRDAFFLPINTKTFTAYEGEAVAGAQLSLTLNVAQSFPPPAVGTTVLRWRVGARNSRDPVAPRAAPGLAEVYPQDEGFVWGRPASATFTYTPGEAEATSTNGRAPRRIRILGPLSR